MSPDPNIIGRWIVRVLPEHKDICNVITSAGYGRAWRNGDRIEMELMCVKVKQECFWEPPAAPTITSMKSFRIKVSCGYEPLLATTIVVVITAHVGGWLELEQQVDDGVRPTLVVEGLSHGKGKE